MRIPSFVIICILLSGTAEALDIHEEGGGFRFTLPEDFSVKPNPRKSLSPFTQFDILFSRESHAMLIPSGWLVASLSQAIDDSIKLASDGMNIKVKEHSRNVIRSKSGTPAIRVTATIEGGDSSFLIIIAFCPRYKRAVTYTCMPGSLDQEATLRMMDALAATLVLDPIKPNHAPEPTAPSVTPRAEPRVAPAGAAAHP